MENNSGLNRFVYEQLLIIYPQEFRERFGAEMADVFDEAMRDALVERGFVGATSLWLSSLWELGTTAVGSWLKNEKVMAGAAAFFVASFLFVWLAKALSR